MEIIGFRNKELATCKSIATIATPAEYKTIYKHMAALSCNRGGLTEEAWINKMFVMTTKINERQYEDKQASSIIENVLLDSQIKHMNLK